MGSNWSRMHSYEYLVPGPGGHFGSHFEFRMTNYSENIFVGRIEFLDPSNPTLDTKITALGVLVIEI